MEANSKMSATFRANNKLPIEIVKDFLKSHLD